MRALPLLSLDSSRAYISPCNRHPIAVSTRRAAAWDSVAAPAVFEAREGCFQRPWPAPSLVRSMSAGGLICPAVWRTIHGLKLDQTTGNDPPLAKPRRALLSASPRGQRQGQSPGSGVPCRHANDSSHRLRGLRWLWRFRECIIIIARIRSSLRQTRRRTLAARWNLGSRFVGPGCASLRGLGKRDAGPAGLAGLPPSWF